MSQEEEETALEDSFSTAVQPTVPRVSSSVETNSDDEDGREGLFQPLRRMFSEASATVFSYQSNSERRMTKGAFVGAVANLCSATLGAGILALPFAMHEAGLVFGLILLFVSAWGTASSIDMLVRASDVYRLSTYENIVGKVLGLRWRKAVEISILIFCEGTAVGYVIAVGDIIERVEYLDGSHRRVAMSLVWVLAMLPLSCLRRVQNLQCASGIGIISIGTLLVAATVHLLLPGDGNDASGSSPLGMQNLEEFLWPNNGGLSVLRACPMFFFAFSCQCNVAQIYDELPGPRGSSDNGPGRMRSMGWVTWVAIGLCTTLYAGISIVTLLDFGNKLMPNILSCYNLRGKESALLHAAFLGMSLAIVTAFPLNIFPARVSIIQMWENAFAMVPSDPMIICMDNEEARQPLISKKEGSKYTDNDSSELMERGNGEDPLEQTAMPGMPEHDPGFLEVEDEDIVEFRPRQHFFVTLLLAGAALGLALIVPNISVVFGLLGGTTSALLGFVVPGLLGLEMDRSNRSAWILVVAGTIIGIVTTGVTLYSTITEAI